MKNIVLIGMPGCGKSTLGKALAEKLGRPFIDADSYLEEREGKTIPELFAVSETCFRDAEERTIKELSQQEGLVIATGGGVVKRASNIDCLRQSGVILFIDRSPDDIVSDVEVGTRPLLAEGPEKVYVLYQERIAMYRKSADIQIHNQGTLAEVLENIAQAVKGI